MKIFKCLILGIFLIFVVAAAIHFIHAYQRVIVQRPEASVTIPEGSTMYDIDRILSAADVIQPGAFIAAAQNATGTAQPLEGKLFPDTYDFFLNTTATSVIEKMTDNFAVKAAPLFAADPQDATNTQNAERDLIIASIVQKEVPSSTDEAIVAGIIDKRLATGIPLDIDATICYIKQQENPTSTAACELTAADFKIDSPYNTYKYRGLPPAPIGNPGLQAIQAALNPQTSTYLYYLSDPKTGKTIYAATLAQQEANQRKYLQ